MIFTVSSRQSRGVVAGEVCEGISWLLRRVVKKEGKVQQDRYLGDTTSEQRISGLKFFEMWKVILRTLNLKWRPRMKQHWFYFNLLSCPLSNVPSIWIYFQLLPGLLLKGVRATNQAQSWCWKCKQKHPPEESTNTFLSAYLCPHKRKLLGRETIISTIYVDVGTNTLPQEREQLKWDSKE